ncbi:hypothetical protein KEM54_000147, partial [Ascosphaera aggregata]
MDTNKAQGAPALDYSDQRPAKENLQDTQPTMTLKPSMSRYRRVRNTVKAIPGLTVAIPKHPITTSSDNTTASSSIEERLERARILAETQRQLEGNWWDQRPTSRDTSCSNWWEDKRPVTQDRHEASNPFRDPASRSRPDQLQSNSVMKSPQATRDQFVTSDTQNWSSPRAAGHSTSSSQVSTPVTPTHVMDDSRKPRFQREGASNPRQASRSRYRRRTKTNIGRPRSLNRRGSDGEVVPNRTITTTDTLPSDLPSLEATRLSKIHTLAGLDRAKPIRDAGEVAPSFRPYNHGEAERPAVKSPRAPQRLLDFGARQSGLRIDAPVSAADKGARHVIVAYNDMFSQVPIITSTKARDALASAGSLFSEPIDARNSVLLETCPILGLERPIRMYERLRRVMDTWDSDSKNGFSIISHPSEDSILEAEKMAARGGLQVLDAPRKQPDGVTFQLHHSNQSEKWNKRYVTIRPDGQVQLSKKESLKEAINVCHMSDFDIYCLRPRHGSKFKPPKKYCYAIKSQQKLNMFLSTDDYIQYFSTNNAEVANDFYDAVQSWRSWYLLRLMADKPQSSGSSGESVPATPSDAGCSPTTSPSSNNARRDTAIAHQLGSLKPLISMESMDLEPEPEPAGEVEKRLSDSNKLVSRAKTVHKVAPGRYKKTAAVYDDVIGAFAANRSRAATVGQASSGLPDEPFMSDGLLGKQYEERQKEMRAREAYMSNNVDSPGRPVLDDQTTPQIFPRSVMQRERGRCHATQDITAESRARSRARSIVRPVNNSSRNHPKPPQHPLVNLDTTVGAQIQPVRKGLVPATEEPSSRDAICQSKTDNWRSRSRPATQNRPN